MNDKLVPLAIFPFVSTAHICRSYLEACDIPSFIFDEHVSGYGWSFGTKNSGVRLMVHNEDYDEALMLLKENKEIDFSDVIEEE